MFLLARLFVPDLSLLFDCSRLSYITTHATHIYFQYTSTIFPTLQHHHSGTREGCFDKKITKDWVKMVWSRRDGGPSRKPILLVLDAFGCHKTNSRKELRDYNTVLVIIPGGMTSLLQPLDVCINKPLKTGLHQVGRTRKVDLPTICGWIVKVWRSISEDLIRRSFVETCISNNKGMEEVMERSSSHMSFSNARCSQSCSSQRVSSSVYRRRVGLTKR